MLAMPNVSMIFGRSDTHLLGKIMDLMHDEKMRVAGFTKMERARAEGLFEDLDRHLNRTVSLNWNDVEVV